MRPSRGSKNGRVADPHQFHHAGQKTTRVRSGFHRARSVAGDGQQKKDPVPGDVRALAVAPDPGTKPLVAAPRIDAPRWSCPLGAHPKWPPLGSSPAHGSIVLHILV